MTDINRNNFLAELSKLLTFMYEEDRATALDMYEDIFESCPDEQQLIHHLVSPTRQAVVLARAYDSKERMLHVDTRSKANDLYEEEEDMIPGFVLAIEKIGKEASHLFGSQPALPVSDEQISLFPAEDEELDAVIPPVEKLIQDSEPPKEDAPVTAESVTVEEIVEEEAVSVLSETAVTENVQTAELIVEDDAAGDDVDSFLAGYENDVPVVYKDGTVQGRTYRESAQVRSIRRERSVPLLILYSLVAVPVCFVGIVLLLMPTLLFMSLSFVFAAAGIAAVGCAFGSFVIFADILVVLGTGLVLLALGLLFLWLFVWFIGCVMTGLVNGAIKLGNRLCTREVAV